MKRESFSEDEARRILARATERQEAADRARLGSGAGVSLAELKEIGREVGIEASHVQAAAGELVLLDDADEPAVRLGVPAEVVEMRMLPGTVSDRQWEQMVGVFREAFGRAGLTSQFGDVREWLSTENTRDGKPVHIRLEPGEDGTLVEIRQSTRGLLQVGAVLGGSFGGIGLTLGALLALTEGLDPAVWVLPALMGAMGAFSAIASWIGARSFVKKRTVLLDTVADKVELIGRPQDE